MSNMDFEEDEKSVLLISNGSAYHQKSNTLTHFSGVIPKTFLEEHKNWMVSLKSCGLHLNLKQKLVSKNEAHPIMINITYKDFEETIERSQITDMTKLSLNMFKNYHKIYLNSEKSYTARSLVRQIRLDILKKVKRNHGIWCGSPVEFDNTSKCVLLGQFKFDDEFNDLPTKEERRKFRTIVFLNKYFKKHLKLAHPEKAFSTTYIDGEKYYYFFNSIKLKFKSYYPFKSEATNFPLQKPKLIQVMSPNIGSCIYNNCYKQCLKQFSAVDQDIGRFLQKEFEGLEYFNIPNKSINSFEIKFVDEQFKQIRLRQGTPSFVRLTFKPKVENMEYVRISSEGNSLFPNNDISNFSVDLPKELDFTYKKNPKVALTRISLSNKWNIMPGLNFDFLLFDLTTDEMLYFKCEKKRGGPRTCQEIRIWFEKEIKSSNIIKPSKQTGGMLTFKFQKPAIFAIGKDLGQCLGFAFADKLLHNTSIDIDAEDYITTNFYQSKLEVNEEIELTDAIKKAVDFYQSNQLGESTEIGNFFSAGNIIISGKGGSTFDLQYKPRNIELFPSTLYIYSNFVSSTAVLGEYRRLLRIASLPYNKQDQNITIDFPIAEFLTLSESKLKVLQFKIVSSDGRYIVPFDKSEDIFLTLLFTY